MVEDKPLLGIALMLGFCLLAPLGDSVAKLLGGVVSIGHLVAVRFVAQTVVLVPLVLYFSGGKGLILRGRVLWLAVLRTVLHISGISVMFVALQHLPVADAIAIAFVLPFMMLFLGWLVLGETIGPHRIIACLVGFIGTLLVIQPNLVEAGYYALLPLLGALIFAVFILATRSVAKEIGAVELQAVSGLLACLIILPVLLAAYTFGFLPQALEVRSVDLTTGGLLLALGLIGTCAHLLMTWSLRFAPSATLAPMQYIEIPIATFFGWLIFSDLPDGLAAVGIMVTVCAGLYIIMREHRLAKAAAKLA